MKQKQRMTHRYQLSFTESKKNKLSNIIGTVRLKETNLEKHVKGIVKQKIEEISRNAANSFSGFNTNFYKDNKKTRTVNVEKMNECDFKNQMKERDNYIIIRKQLEQSERILASSRLFSKLESVKKIIIKDPLLANRTIKKFVHNKQNESAERYDLPKLKLLRKNNLYYTPENHIQTKVRSKSKTTLRIPIHYKDIMKKVKVEHIDNSAIKKHPKTSRIDNVKEDDLYYSNSQLNSIVENQFHISNSSKRDSSSSEEIILKSKNPKENNDSIEIDPQLQNIKNKLVRTFSAWKDTAR